MSLLGLIQLAIICFLFLLTPFILWHCILPILLLPLFLLLRGLFHCVVSEGLLGFCTRPCLPPSAVLFTSVYHVLWFPSRVPDLLHVTSSLLNFSIWMIHQNFPSACARLTLFPSTPVPPPVFFSFCLHYFCHYPLSQLDSNPHESSRFQPLTNLCTISSQFMGSVNVLFLPFS